MIHRRKKADGKTVYDVRVGDSPKKTFNRYDDAAEYENELKRSRKRSRAGLGDEKPNITFRELVQLWDANFAPSEWRTSMVAYSLNRWGKVRVRDLQPEQIGAWLADLKGRNDQPLSTKTRAHILESLRQVLNAGVEWGYLSRSPARRGAFKVPSKRARVRPIRPFESWAEVEAVAAACADLNPIAGPLVRFVCATGLRTPGEVVTLQWSQIDLKAKTLTVGSKTAAGHRTVPLSRLAIEALEDLPRSLSGYVFPGKRDARFDYLNWRDTDWRLALTTCDLEYRTPYEMRHTFATLALANGASIDDVATVMGHKDITVAFDYYRKWIKTAADRLRDQLDLMDSTDNSDLAKEVAEGSSNA